MTLPYIPCDPPPLNRRIYAGMKASVIGALMLPLHMAANLWVPAIFASLPTLFLMLTKDEAFSWYFTTASGTSELAAMFLAFMFICTSLYLAFRLLIWIVL